MKKTTKKIASLCAAVMMMASFALGADAVVVDKTDSFSTTYYASSCLATLKNDTAQNYYVRVLTKCKQKCYKLHTEVEVLNSSGVSTGYQEDTKTNVTVGTILTPSMTGRSYKGKKAVYRTYYQTASGGSKHEDKRVIPIG